MLLALGARPGPRAGVVGKPSFAAPTTQPCLSLHLAVREPLGTFVGKELDRGITQNAAAPFGIIFPLHSNAGQCISADRALGGHGRG